MIRNEYRVTWDLFQTWLWENKKKPTRSAFTIMWIVFGLAATVMGVVFRYPFYFIFTVFSLYRALFRDILAAGRQYETMAKTYGQKDWLRTITFDEENITVVEGNISVNYKYPDISEIREKDNKVWLQFKDKMVIRLYKDCFADAGWEEGRSLIERKRNSNMVH